jgi:rhodanese-related sulfurtransferase
MNQLSAQELREWISQDKDFHLVDIREGWERDQYHIGGVHLPLGILFSKLDELPKHKDLVIYCEKGVRSVFAIQRLETSGFDRLYNLSGGVQAWKAIA